MVKGQIHEQFKTAEGADLAQLAIDMNAFLKAGNFAAKSISVITHPPNQFVLSIGYSSGDEAYYPISVESVSLGNTLGIGFDSAIASAAENVKGEVICHSLYLHHGEYVAVFLTH